MIYVVDDAADYRFLVQQVFKKFLVQYPLRLFTGGLELMEHVELGEPIDGSSRPDLIVLDVDMPHLNGFQTLERLKQSPLWQLIPVVMMSGRSDSKFSEAAYELGAESYILKPIALVGLQHVMSQLCHQWIDGSTSLPGFGGPT